jgi:hypothetical protein
MTWSRKKSRVLSAEESLELEVVDKAKQGQLDELKRLVSSAPAPAVKLRSAALCAVLTDRRVLNEQSIISEQVRLEVVQFLVDVEKITAFSASFRKDILVNCFSGNYLPSFIFLKERCKVNLNQNDEKFTLLSCCSLFWNPACVRFALTSSDLKLPTKFVKDLVYQLAQDNYAHLREEFIALVRSPFLGFKQNVRLFSGVLEGF